MGSGAAERYGDGVLGGASDIEVRRLDAIARVSDPFSRERLHDIGVALGHRCWEVGAGNGTIARWLCERVSTSDSGSVLASDIDTRHLATLDVPGLVVLEHDVVNDDPPGHAFDLIHARFLLEHLRERESVIDRLVDVLAPGGWLVVESLASFPIESATDREFQAAMQSVEQVLGQTIGTDCDWARTFPRPLAMRGLERTGAAINAPATGMGNASADCWALTLEQLEPRILEFGLATTDDLAVVRRRLRDPAFCDFGFATVAAWGRRPQT